VPLPAVRVLLPAVKVPLPAVRVPLPVCGCHCLFKGAAARIEVPLPIVGELPVAFIFLGGCHILLVIAVAHLLPISAVGFSFVRVWGFVLIPVTLTVVA
jgi:hypothetical protein